MNDDARVTKICLIFRLNSLAKILLVRDKKVQKSPAGVSIFGKNQVFFVKVNLGILSAENAI